MQFSIITAVYSGEFLEENLDSVASQQGVNAEHIVVAKAPLDRKMTKLRNERDNLIWVSGFDNSPFEAMNTGLAMAMGDIVGFLHSGDFYVHPGVLALVYDCLEESEWDACYGDLVYVRRKDVNHIVRIWKSRPFHPGLFRYGWMPPHPAFYARREVYDRYGAFDTRYSIGSDWDMLMRLMELEKIRTKYIPEILVKMRLGGMSNSSTKNIMKNNVDCLISCLCNRFWPSPLWPFTKLMDRLSQFQV